MYFNLIELIINYMLQKAARATDQLCFERNLLLFFIQLQKANYHNRTGVSRRLVPSISFLPSFLEKVKIYTRV